MITFKQYITEALNRPYKWKRWKEDEDLYYQFTSDAGDLYTINFDEWDGLIFWLGDEDGYKKDDVYQAKVLTDKKDLRVLSTVAHVVEDIIKRDKPENMNFDSTSSSRTAVYARMIKRSSLIKKYYKVERSGNTIKLELK